MSPEPGRPAYGGEASIATTNLMPDASSPLRSRFNRNEHRPFSDSFQPRRIAYVPPSDEEAVRTC
jgi:hypothetical protein